MRTFEQSARELSRVLSAERPSPVKERSPEELRAYGLRAYGKTKDLWIVKLLLYQEWAVRRRQGLQGLPGLLDDLPVLLSFADPGLRAPARHVALEIC